MSSLTPSAYSITGVTDDVSIGFASSSIVTRCRLSPKVLSKVSVNKLNMVLQRFVLERWEGATTCKITINRFKVWYKIKWEKILTMALNTVQKCQSNSTKKASASMFINVKKCSE